MIKLSLWLRCTLTGYLWLIALVPLGNWNKQRGDYLLNAIIKGKGIESGDVGLLVFITLPALLFWIGYKKTNVWFCIAALLVDAIWLVMQILSWWVPCIAGTNKTWALEYAKGPTTKILPSFGNHVAPDAMHFAIQVLLISAIVTGVYGIYHKRFTKQKPSVKAHLQ
jgi:hypothetical protein